MITSLARRSFVLSTAMLTLAGCSGLFGPSTTPLILKCVVSDRLNLNENNEATSLVVRLLDLRAEEAFLTLDFYDLYDRDQSRLGADLLGRREVTLIPGRTEKPLERELGEDVQFLGIVAAFRDLSEAQWRVSIKLNRGRKNEFTLEFKERRVTFTKGIK